MNILGNRWIGLGLIGLMVVFGLVVSAALPERVPIHWGLNGEVDGYGSKTLALWLTPAIGLGLWLLFGVLPQVDPVVKDRGVALKPILGRYANAILLFLAVVHVLMLGFALGWPISVVKVIGIGVGLLFVVLGSGLGSLQRNSFAGIRVPWTMTDDEVWRESHRVGGRIMMICGALIALSGLLLPVVAEAVAIGIFTVAMLIGILGYSYWVAMQKRRLTSVGVTTRQGPQDKS